MKTTEQHPANMTECLHIASQQIFHERIQKT